jgi:uncharacterized membrane protein
VKLFLISYASAAIVVPAFWIGARLWLQRHSQTPAPGLVSAQIIAFPIAMVASKRRHVPPHLETNGQRLTRSERRRLQKADEYVAQRRQSSSQNSSITRVDNVAATANVGLGAPPLNSSTAD